MAFGCLSCGTRSDTGGGQAATSVAVYDVRGEIARLPDPSSPEIWIRHESIPDFRNASGKVVGMDSMTMPFGVGSGEPLDQLAVGDRIAFRLEIDWDAPGAGSRVVGLRRLEPGTRLEFDPPAESEGEATDQEAEEPEGATPR